MNKEEGDPAFQHEPVMLHEVLDLVRPVPAGLFVDATVGGGGHASAILDARPDLHLLGIDRDPAAVAAAGERLRPFGDRARVVHGGFEAVATIVRAAMTEDRREGIVGILFDLGVSSPQLDRPVRGFSYWADEAPLDMRMDSAQELTAATVVNEYAESDLAAIIARNGEERYARRIAAEIVAARPLQTTGELVEAIKRGIPAPARRRGGHPARRSFQAIRMEVNRELPNLAAGLDESVHLLGPQGREIVLAYHSLEDRMVKERFTDWSREEAPEYVPRGLPREARNPLTKLLTRRALRPADAELASNSRAGSVRLRAVERLP
ncbi:MAG: 16S rRNA (cytosine(1402)-N(4))-methyltransferase RsmH [Acidimicrobiia bacterium]